VENVTGLKYYTEDMESVYHTYKNQDILIATRQGWDQIKYVFVEYETEAYGRGAFLSAVKLNWKVGWSVRK
jgi:hypothetical protein